MRPEVIERHGDLCKVRGHDGRLRLVHASRLAEALADPDALVTPAQASELLHVTTKTLARWAADGRMLAVRTPGGHRRFLAIQVDALARARNAANHQQLDDKRDTNATVTNRRHREPPAGRGEGHRRASTRP